MAKALMPPTSVRMADVRPMHNLQIDHLVQVLEDIDKPFGHFEVPSIEYPANAAEIHKRAEEEQSNFTLIDDNGKPRAHITVCQHEWPHWEEDGPRLLKTVLMLRKKVQKLQAQLNEIQSVGEDAELSE